MPKNKIEDLRNHLFEVIEMVKDGDMDVDKAKAIAAVAGQINQSAKIEVQFLSLKAKHGGGIKTHNSLLKAPKNEV